MVLKWKINSTSAFLFQHITKKYTTRFFSLPFFHGLGINKPWSHWQIPAKDHRECVLLNISLQPNLCLLLNPQYYCVDNFFSCGVHTWNRGQIVWGIFCLQCDKQACLLLGLLQGIHIQHYNFQFLSPRTVDVSFHSRQKSMKWAFFFALRGLKEENSLRNARKKTSKIHLTIACTLIACHTLQWRSIGIKDDIFLFALHDSYANCTHLLIVRSRKKKIPFCNKFISIT